MSNPTEFLLTEKITVFNHDVIDRDQWLALLDFSADLQTRHADQLARYNYSFVQESFYALIGCTTDKSPLGKAWAKLSQRDSFQSLVPLMYDRVSSANAVTVLADDLMSHIFKTVKPGDKPEKIIRRLHGFDPEFDISDRVAGQTAVDGALLAFMDGSDPIVQRGQVEQIHQKYNVRAFASILGWVRGTVSAEKRKIHATVGEFSHFKPGSLNETTTRLDMVRLAMGDNETLIRAADDYLSNEIATEIQPAGRGPVILLLDRSQSMNDPDETDRSYTRLQTMRAVELALATVFNEENRELIAIYFNASTQTPMHIYGDIGLTEHLRVIATGGTLIQAGLAKALEVADGYAQNADIWIVSDGDLQTEPRFTQEQQINKLNAALVPYRANGGSVWCTVIGNPFPEMIKTWGFCDGVIGITSFTNPTADLTDILSKIAKPRGGDSTGSLTV